MNQLFLTTFNTKSWSMEWLVIFKLFYIVSVYLYRKWEKMPNKILWWRLIILKEIDAQLWDTAGQEEFERIRILSYENTTCFIVCFCVADYVTFDNVKKLWLPELRRHNPEAKVLLVGTKSDMRIPKAEKRRDDGKRGKTLRNKEVFYYKFVCQNLALYNFLQIY